MNQNNKEFSVVIRFIPLTSMTNHEYEFLAEEFTFHPAAASDAGGTIFNCDQERIIMRPAAEVLSEFGFLRSGIVVYRDTAGKEYQIGTSDIPARIMLSPTITAARLIIKCSMLQSPLV